MALKLSSIKIDLTREREGAWIEIPEWPGVALLTRGFQYGPFKTARDAFYKDLAKRHGKNTDSEDELFDINGKLIADHLLLGWRGIVDDQEKQVPFTRETALELLTDRGWRVFQTKANWAAAQLEMVDAEFVKDTEKN